MEAGTVPRQDMDQAGQEQDQLEASEQEEAVGQSRHQERALLPGEVAVETSLGTRVKEDGEFDLRRDRPMSSTQLSRGGLLKHVKAARSRLSPQRA